MILSEQVANQGLCEKMKELGVKQESHFHWYSVKGDRQKDCYVSCDDGGYGYKICSAFSVAELLQMLPEDVNGFDLEITRAADIWLVRYFEEDYERETRFGWQKSRSLADACAEMLIYLLEQKD